jgi:xylan 1,4-beta-xylosidase
MMRIFFVTLVLFLGMLTAFSQEINVDANQQGEKFEHLWSKCVGAGRANEALRAGWLEQLELVQETCGFETVRFHGLFHDDMFPVLEENGNTVYNWQYIDDVFDRMLDLNVRPFVELSFFPPNMAAEDSHTVFWWKAKTTPGPDYLEKWHDLVKAFTQHCVDRYGIDEIRSWYFEVWNEPNLSRAFWDGTKSQYFALYKASVKAVRSVDSQLMVGGPSTSNFVADDRYEGERENTGGFTKTFTAENINELEWRGVWIEDFLKYCEKEKLPLDFISCHPYPTDYPLDPRTGKGKDFSRFVNSTVIDIKWLNDVMAKSAYPNAEIHLTEWNTSPNSRDAMHDFLPPAAYIVRTNLECIGLTNSLAFWTFTDIFEEKGGAASIFHGGFGMINFQGLVKPSYHAYRMLHELGDEKLYKNDYLFVSRNSGDNKLVALAYNYPEDHYNAVPSSIKRMAKYEDGKSRKLNFSLSGLKPGTQFKIEILDKDHGNIYNSWENMGKPEPPTREQIQVLKKAANALKIEIVTAAEDGNLNIDREMSPWSLVLIKQIN